MKNISRFRNYFTTRIRKFGCKILLSVSYKILVWYFEIILKVLKWLQAEFENSNYWNIKKVKFFKSPGLHVTNRVDQYFMFKNIFYLKWKNFILRSITVNMENNIMQNIFDQLKYFSSTTFQLFFQSLLIENDWLIIITRLQFQQTERLF